MPQANNHTRNVWILGGAAAALVVAGVVAFAYFGTSRHAVNYTAVAVTRGKVTRTVTATGTVNPVLTIVVGTYVSGVIESLFCDYDAPVRTGQVCAKIDPRPNQATLDQYSAQLQRDQAILAKDRADLVRYNKLAEQNAIAHQQADDQAFVVNQDEATVKLDQALVDGARLNLAYTNIVSPVDGTVVSRNVSGGQTVAASFQTPTMFLIATDLKQMQVDTNTSEGDMGGVRENNSATFTVDAYPQRVFTGKVTQIRQSPQTVQNVVTYDVVVGFDNADLALMPGMTAATTIIIAERDDVLRVPDQALRFVPSAPHGAAEPAAPDKTARVFVLRDGKAVAVPIVAGLDDGNVTEVTGGELKEGDLVITAERTTQAGAAAPATPPRF
ncbi:MAG: efflux RND transporter periplasmic adaptor subunit [Xanthobacteraceae bacterium]|nr:efflux RND transporter periplasmic adaptor subunit [Xanthobacteraceae bacterium]